MQDKSPIRVKKALPEISSARGNGRVPALRNQCGASLVELLIVVAILGIIGGVTGLFLIKYLPEFNLRGAANTLTQDIRTTQMNALKRLRPWQIAFNNATHVYQITDSVDGTFGNADDIVMKTVNLTSYESMIRFGAGTGTRVRYNEEGLSEGTTTIILTNSAGAAATINVLRTGAIRVTR